MNLQRTGATARSVWVRLRRYVIATLSTVYTLCRTGVSKLVVVISASSQWASSKGMTAFRYLVDGVLEAERTHQQLRRLRSGLLGIRYDRSVVALLAAPVLALGAQWWVVNSYGYRQLHSWVVGTWTGTNPQLVVFVGLAAVTALSVAFTVVNSGLLPAMVLSMGPSFGIGFARYGLTFEQYGTVGIPEATAFAGFVAIAFGVPIGIAGFLIGTVARHGIAHFGERPESDGISWER